MYQLNEKEIPTLNESEAIALGELKNKILLKFNVIQIILFGSKARGDYNEDSDIDILVIVSDQDNHKNRMKLYDIVFEVNIKHLTDFSCRLRNHHNWLLGEGEYPTFKVDVLEEGIEIEL
jgi:predicted nucleotidyltransferase